MKAIDGGAPSRKCYIECVVNSQMTRVKRQLTYKDGPSRSCQSQQQQLFGAPGLKRTSFKLPYTPSPLRPTVVPPCNAVL